MTAHLRPPSEPTVTERLADHVVGLRYDDIPAAVIEKAKSQIVHLFGAGMRGYGREDGPRAVDLAHDLGGSGGDCSIVGDPAKVNLLDAVFANSYLVGRSEVDDFIPQGGNPGIVTHPVAWALGEANRATGRDVLVAVISAYDVLGRLLYPGFTWGRNVFDPAKFILEPFAAAACAARLLGLTRAQTVHAFGHAGQVGRNAVESGDHAWTMHPLAARNGGMAAMLARAGMTSSATVIEGDTGVFQSFFSQDGVPDFVEAGLATLGKEFAIAQAQTKRQSGSALNVIPVELTQHVLDKHALSADRIAALEIVVPEERRARETKRENAMRGPRADRTSRLASLGFRTAMTVVDGRIDPARFERPPDADLLAVLEKVWLSYEPGHPLFYARVEVTTTDGQRYAADGETPRPSPSLDWTEWLAEGGRAVLTDGQLTQLAVLVGNLEDVADFSEVMACVVPVHDERQRGR